MTAKRRHPLLVALALLETFLPGAWAEGPKKEYFYNAATELTFAVQGMDATATFLKDEKNEVTQLIFHTPAGDLPAKKTDHLESGGRSV